jgi:hypothetical protein
MQHDWKLRVFHVESGEELELVMEWEVTSEGGLRKLAWDYVRMMNEAHAEFTEHTVEFHDGEPRTFRAELYDGGVLLGSMHEHRLDAN